MSRRTSCGGGISRRLPGVVCAVLTVLAAVPSPASPVSGPDPPVRKELSRVLPERETRTASDRDARSGKTPSRFQRAQQLAWDGRRERARELLQEILTESPGHHDARVLLARTFAWDHFHDLARAELEHVLRVKPDYIDAYRAQADNELWARRYGPALEAAESGMRRKPDDAELRYRRAQALEKLEREDEAREDADHLRGAYPDDERFEKLARRLRIKTIRWWGTLGYRHEEFDQLSDPWEELTVGFKRRMRWGSLLGRVRHARRFGEGGEQLEVDAYPKLKRRRYLYLNLGLGGDPFPDLRSGAEIFQNFGHGWEASGGLRYLDFRTSDVLIYTGSISKYVSDYWISLRPIFTSKSSGISRTWGLTMRRYLAADTWVGGTVSLGEKPDPALVDGDGERLESSRYNLSGQFRLGELWGMKADIGFREQDVTTTRGRDSYVGSISFTRAF